MSIKSRIRRYLTRRLGVPEIPLALERLSQAGFKPTQIFDVGAYKGEFAQYCFEVWPNAKVACFEAQEDQVVQLKQLSNQNSNLQVFPILIGSKIKEKVALHKAETASSVLCEQIEQNFPVTFHQMQTVDKIVQENFRDYPPDFLKIDVQGYELEVLKGAEKSLDKIQVILAEVNLLDIHKNVPLLSDIVTWLNDRDWVAYDICGLTRRPLDQALWQADFIFVPRNSSLRSDKHWTV